MNKLFTKIAALALGATMAVGVGVAVASSSKAAEPAQAVDYTKVASYNFNGTGSGTAKYSTSELKTRFADSAQSGTGLSDIVSSVTAASNVYASYNSTYASLGLKFGTSSANGSFTVSTSKSITRAVVVAAGWGTKDTVKVGSASAQTPGVAYTSSDALKTLTFDITSSTSIQFTVAKRGFIQSIDFYETATSGYTITPTITNGTSTGDSRIASGGTASVTITPNSGYKLPADVTVTGATKSYDSTTGVVSLSNPTGNVTISATCPALQSYSITKTITHGSASGATSINENGNATVTITPDTGYKLPSTVSVTGATSSYNSSTGVVSLSNPTGNVTVSATMDTATQYSVSYSLTRLTASPSPTTIYENEEVSITLSVTDSSKYSLPTSITVTNSSGYAYNSSTGVISLHGSQGNVTITASAIAKPAEATEAFEFVSAAESGWTATGSTYGGYTKTVDLITVTYDKTSDANNEYWNPKRFYSNMPINIVATTGAGAVNTIKTVTFYTGSSTYPGKLSSSNVAGGGSMSASTSGNNRIFTATGTVTSLTVTASSRSDVNKIEVVYDRDQSEVDLQSISATCADVLVSQQVSPVITFTPAGASNKNVSYEIVEGTSSLAEVSASGVITGLGAGTARLKITPEDTHASAITIDVVVSALPSIYGVEVGKKYAATSNGYELTGINASNYGESTSYSGDPSNSFPIRVVNGLYAHTIALEVTINDNTKYLSWDADTNTNSLNYVDSIGRYSSWIFAEVSSELLIRNVGNYARVLCFYGGTTLRFNCYPEATASGDNCTSLTFIEIAEAKTAKEYVQDFVDLYLHMTDYTESKGWCSDGEHSYYSTAKSGYNTLIYSITERETIWSTDGDFAAAKLRYETWAAKNGDSNPYDGNDFNKASAKTLGPISILGSNENVNVVAIVVITSVVSLTAIGGYFFLRKRREQN